MSTALETVNLILVNEHNLKPIESLTDGLVYAFKELGLNHLTQLIRDEHDQIRRHDLALLRAADPKRTICAGIWRTRGGRVHDVKPNTTGYLDALPWIVDDHYTVNDAGYTYPDGALHAYDLMTLEKAA